MKAPAPAGAPIDMARVRAWLDDFAGYRVTVSEGRIDRWLAQFAPEHRHLAARLLDVVEFIGNDAISAAYRHGLRSMPGWSRDSRRRSGRWAFVAFAGSSGESGDMMLARFRTANSLSGKNFNPLFLHRSELMKFAPGPDDTVVLIDDFAGTGTQACNAWTDIYQELLPLGPRVVLLLVATSHTAKQRIDGETGMLAVAHVELQDRDRLFHESCTHFTDAEKQVLLDYCSMADPRLPMGYGDCAFVIVFAHKCPNNSLPVLHVRSRAWEGLFRRHD